MVIKKIITAIVGILLLLVMAGCSANWHAQQVQKHINKAKMKDPDISFVDTVKVPVTVIVPKYVYDTTFLDVGDTVIIENERIKTVYKRDTVTNEVFIETECKPDTVVVEADCPQETIFVTKKHWSQHWGFKVGVGIGVVLLILGLIKRLVP